MSQALSSLAQMTLRQLRQVASDLGVSLYSRKTKEQLVNAISTRQPLASSSGDAETPAAGAWNDPSLSSLEADLAPAPGPSPRPGWCSCPVIPNGPMCFGRSPMGIVSRPNRPAPASSACGSPMSPA